MYKWVTFVNSVVIMLLILVISPFASGLLRVSNDGYKAWKGIGKRGSVIVEWSGGFCTAALY